MRFSIHQIFGTVLLALFLAGAAGGQEPDFTSRVREALERTRNVKVIYQDVLGEGPGSWDPDPRYPGDTVNCITWLHLLLAETYGRNPEEKLQVMDRLRYFGGHPGFGLRKHYIDQWTELDPLPLRKVDFSFCPQSAVARHDLDLTPASFAKNVNYACPLYGQARASFELDVVPPHGLVQCAGRLPEGYYVLFPVASDRYLQRYGALSGPMGQVHAVLLSVQSPPGTPSEARDAAEFRVYHASISSGKVVETKLGSYVLHMWNLYRGYVLYELVPDWSFTDQPPLDEEARAIAACEAKLPGRVGKLFENEAQPAQAPRP